MNQCNSLLNRPNQTKDSHPLTEVIKSLIWYSDFFRLLYLNQSKGHCTLSLKFPHAFFRITHPFLSKCMLRMRKRSKSNLFRIFYDGRKFRRQCVNLIDTTWGRIYFLTCENFGLRVQRPFRVSKFCCKGYFTKVMLLLTHVVIPRFGIDLLVTSLYMILVFTFQKFKLQHVCLFRSPRCNSIGS